MKIKPAVFTIDLSTNDNKQHEGFNSSSSSMFECKSIGGSSSGDSSCCNEDKVTKGFDCISISSDEPSSEIGIDKHSHHGSGHHAPLSTCSALVYLMKANLGAGLFAIPAAFKNAGLVGGSFGIPIMALLSIHCMHMLIKCSSVMKQRKGDKEVAMDYPEVLETACLTGPPSMVKYATYARQFVRMKLFMKSLIFCSVLLLFAGTYLHQLMSYYSKDVEDWPLKHWGVRHWTATLSIVAIPLACVRQYKYLYPLSYVASAIKGLSLIVLFYFILQDLPSTTERPNFSTWKYALLFYGTVIFAFEGITQALPLHDNMRTTRHFRAPTGVLNTGMILISCLYFGVGFYGYLKYGDYTYPSITMNLPKDKM